MKQEKDQSDNPFRGVGPYLDLGLRFALAILLAAWGGYWLDTKINTLPLFLIIGVFLGATSGFISIYKAVYTEKRKDSDTE